MRTVAVASLVLLAACSGARPADLGPTADGGLGPCPATPNCVHTGLRYPEGTRALQLAGAWRDDPDGALARIAGVVDSLPRTRVVTREGRYLHAEATSLLFRFVDDLEILVRDDGEVVVRSASRVGRSDLGVNGRRVEELRTRLTEVGLVGG